MFLKLNKLFFAISCVWWSACNVHAQYNDVQGYSVLRYTDENGLPQNSVNCIVSDKQGFIWLSTEGGLVRFDGKDFFTFSSQAMYMSSPRIQAVIGGYGEDELLAINNRNELVKIENGKLGYPSHIPFTYRWIFHTYNPNKKNNVLYFGQPRFNRTPMISRRQLMICNKNAYYVCTKDGVEYHEGKHKKYEIANKEKPGWTYFLLGGDIYCHVGGNRFVSFHNKKAEHFEAENLPVPVTADSHMPVVYWESITQSAFFSYKEVLYKLSKTDDGKIAADVLLRGFNLKENDIVSIYHDEETGNLLLGSTTEGLFVLKKHLFQVLKTGGSRSNDNFYAHAYYKNNTVLSTKGYIIGPDVPVKTVDHPENFRTLSRYSVLKAKHGRKSLWVKDDTVLMEMDESGKILDKWLFNDEVHILSEGEDGVLWIALRRRGIYSMHLNEPAPQPRFRSNLSHCCYLQPGPQSLWVGTSLGLYRIPYDGDEEYCIPGSEDLHVHSIYLEDSIRVWGTMRDKGLFLLRKDQFITFPMDRNKYLANAHCILEDEKGSFWISSNKGLFQASKQDLLNYADGKCGHVYYFYYGKESGFLTNEFNGGCQPCGVKWPDGKLSFPTLNGLVLFDPKQINPEFPDHHIYFQQILLDDQEIPTADTIYLTNDFNRLILYITTPYLGNSNNLNLEVSLQKSEQKETYWSKLDGDNSISFTTLPYGRYNLVVRKPKGFGAGEYEYKHIVLIVPPKFWQTWWFAVACAVVALVLIYLVTKYRIRYIIHKNNELEKMVSERTHDLLETVSALRHSEKMLNKRSKLQQKIILAFSHDLKSPLMYLMITGQKLYGNIAHVPHKMAESIRVMYSSSFDMYHFTDNFLNYAKVFFMNEKPVKEEVNLYKLAEEKIKIFKFIAESKKIEIRNAIAPHVVCKTNRILFSIIIHNLLDNAIKYTEEGFVELTAFRKGDKLYFQVKDTGMGMTEETKKAYSEFFRNGSSERYINDEVGPGLGLQIVKELITMAEGKVEIESGEGKGTLVRIILKTDD